MFSVRHQLVREKKHIPAGQQSHHDFVPTITDDSTLFLIHQQRDQESTRPRRRFWRWFGRRD
ncbi:MAG: hypothetical protein KDL87_04160 [Verrucomicrobiae bacterium]|nr:hypothetical protein [Verrucomicrobiae bacterium]